MYTGNFYFLCVVSAGQHHPTGFATWCRPEHVVISGARDFELGRDYRLVQHAFEARGAKVYHLAEHGSTRFEISSRGVQAFPWRMPLEEE